MDVYDAMVHKCKKVLIIMDKKMREHRIKHERFIIFLGDTVPFDNYDQVKIMRKK